MKGSSICETKFYSNHSHCTLSRVSSAFISLFFFFLSRIYSFCLPSELPRKHTHDFISCRYYIFMCKNICTLTHTHMCTHAEEVTHKEKKETEKISSCLSLLENFYCFSAKWCSCIIYIISTLFLQIIKETLSISNENYIFIHDNLLLLNMWDCYNWTEPHNLSLFPSSYALYYPSPCAFSPGESCQRNNFSKRASQCSLLSHTWSLMIWTHILVLLSGVSVGHFASCFLSSKIGIALFSLNLSHIESFSETR